MKQIAIGKDWRTVGSEHEGTGDVSGRGIDEISEAVVIQLRIPSSDGVGIDVAAPMSLVGDGGLLEALPDGVAVVSAVGQILAVNEQLCVLSGFARAELVGAQIETLVPARFRAEHVAERVAYVGGDGERRSMSARSDIVLVRADGRELPVDVALSTAGVGDERVVVASVRDASARRAAQLMREREYRFMSAMSDVASQLFAEGEVDATLRAITKRSRALLDADLAVLALLHADGQHLHLRIADGHGADIYEGNTVPVESSAVGLVIRDREPILIGDTHADPRAYRPDDWPDDLGPALIVPLQARDETFATLTVANRRGGAMFQPTDVPLLRAFAAHAALALVDARHQVAARRMDVLEDRDRTATDMHDSVIKRISSSALTLHLLLQTELPQSATDRICDVIDQLDAALQSIRRAIFPAS